MGRSRSSMREIRTRQSKRSTRSTALSPACFAPARNGSTATAVARPMTADDVLVVAPYNSQVALLEERLGPKGVRAGTVDRFQGQEAPVVIYSMTTSVPEDAPHGMEFLYSLNRLNVATSRARCACILVANPASSNPNARPLARCNLRMRFAATSSLLRLWLCPNRS